MGATSLLVYWVHTELIYGRWLSAWHMNLTIAQSAAAAAAVIAVMVGLSAARTSYPRWSKYLISLRSQPAPSRVSAD